MTSVAATLQPLSRARGGVYDSVIAFVVAFRARLKDRRFWNIQLMVIGVTISHTVAEELELLPLGDHAAIYFLPASLYLFPVLYASLNFGREGALPTAVWSAALATPNIFLYHHGAERIGEAFQLSFVVLMAIIVATRVDREVAARREAEDRGRAARVSEMKYKELFDNVGQAILVLDSNGLVVEANAAAADLFGATPAKMRGQHARDVVGSGWDEVHCGAADDGRPNDFRLAAGDGETWLEPVCTALPGSDDHLRLCLFRDVTARRGFQSFAQEIFKAQEDERQRIARELHDVSLQSVVLLCRRLDTTNEALSDRRLDDAANAMEATRAAAESIAAELRRFSRDLRPSVLDDLGLVPALRSLVAELASRSGTAGELELEGVPRRLQEGKQLALYRIAQEGLRNVERHSGAGSVRVRLAFGAESVTLSIVDDGRGFRVPAMTPSLATEGRLGLLGMLERARLAGGTCDIHSQPGAGTEVVVHIPSPLAEAAATTAGPLS